MKSVLPCIFYIDRGDNYYNTILLSGSGRSGTTWVSDIINYNNDYRYMFEPWNSKKVKCFKNFSNIQYIRPDNKNNDLYIKIKKILNGKTRNLWINHYNRKIFADKRLIKGIRVNMMLRYIYDNFPEMPIVFIIRSPYATSNSMLKLNWGYHIGEFTSQNYLVEDHLKKFDSLIDHTKGKFEKYILRWCIDNYVPLRQFRSGDIYIAFYENLVLKPEVEIKKMFDYFGKKFNSNVLEMIKKPSRTSRKNSAILNGRDLINSWKKDVSEKQIKNSDTILKEFGLDGLYDKNSIPNEKKLISIMDNK